MNKSLAIKNALVGIIKYWFFIRFGLLIIDTIKYVKGISDFSSGEMNSAILTTFIMFVIWRGVVYMEENIKE